MGPKERARRGGNSRRSYAKGGAAFYGGSIHDPACALA